MDILQHGRLATPQESSVAPIYAHGSRIRKRIIVCCDGTWEDGVSKKQPSAYTNILRLARVINHEDDRFDPPMPQVVFYQPGIGSGNNFYATYVEGTTGSSLGDKVQDAYAFIAHNYQPGDEIYLFGFSRGAYTARMIAEFIGAIGVLDRTEMDHFADIFVTYQKRGKAKDQLEINTLNQALAPWTSHDAPGKMRADSDKDTFSIKCVGVFDTVGSLGLPEELTRRSDEVKTIFGFPNQQLGEHVERAYQALAINETRADFNCTKFQQTEGGRRKGQTLKQCWFTGSHSDIGGGWNHHDLADLTLTWMAANISDMLSLHLEYLFSLPDPVYPWGEQPPHNPDNGIYMLAENTQRTLPVVTDDVTHETIHPSVLQQHTMPPALKATLAKNSALVTQLQALEEEMKQRWPYVPGKKDTDSDGNVTQTDVEFPHDKKSVFTRALEVGAHLSIEALKKATGSHNTKIGDGKTT